MSCLPLPDWGNRTLLYWGAGLVAGEYRWR